MSVVVYRGGVMASDSQAYGGSGEQSPGTKRKIHRLADGTRVGVVTAICGEGERFAAWLEAGADPAAWTGDKPDLRALIVKPSGEVFLAFDGLYLSGPIECDRYAIGSGSAYAFGAMHMGASAQEAVGAAIEFDIHSGGPVQVLEPTTCP